MAFIEKNMRAEDGVHCALCSEPMPKHTWLCPNCIITENPLDLIDDMKSLIVEVGDSESHAQISAERFNEVEATFWTLHGALTASFGREERAVEAMELLENVMYDTVDHREAAKREQKRKRLQISLAIVISIIFGLALMAAAVLLQQ
ncbi:MAG: hypothetical protein SNH79_01185 [Rikenellaceae bacterium]